MTPQLTDQERQEWESWKYSPKVASVLRLTSGRIVVSINSYEIVGVFDNLLEDGYADLLACIEKIATTPLDEYRPPSVRRLDPSLSPSDLKQVDDLLADMELRL